MLVDITYLGDGPGNIKWQAQPQALNSSFGATQAETREAFVAAWNTETGDNKTVDDFQWHQNFGPAED